MPPIRIIKTVACVLVLALTLPACGDRSSTAGVKATVKPPEAPTKSIPRAKVEATVRAFAGRLAERLKSDAAWAARFKADDPASVNEVLRPACTENGITQEEYEWALDEDKDLHELQRKLIAEAVGEK